MKTYLSCLLSTALLSAFSVPCFSAEEEQDSSRAFITIEALLGGSTLETVRFEDGDEDSIRAGSGVYLALGAAHLFREHNISTGVRAGYLFDLITADDNQGNETVLSFTRWPVDVFGHYWIGRHVLGGGVTYHLNPVFSSRDTSDDARYHNATGFYGEYLYHFVGTGSALGVKYLNIDYKNSRNGRVSNGSAWGITFTQSF